MSRAIFTIVAAETNNAIAYRMSTLPFFAALNWYDEEHTRLYFFVIFMKRIAVKKSGELTGEYMVDPLTRY
jgi:hypothetical protein